MSLLHLVHQSVAIKFADAAKNQFNPEVFYAFRLTGVDAMGFLQIQDLRLNSEAGHEVAAEPYWINKDLVLEIHEFHLAKEKESLHFTGKAAKSPVEELAPKISKAKAPAKPKTTLKQKPVMS